MNHDESTPAPSDAQPLPAEVPPAPASSPSEHEPPAGIADLLLFLLFALAALVFLTNALAFGVMHWRGLDLEEVERMARTSAAFITLRQAIWSSLLMLYLFFQVRLRFARPFWRGLGWRALRTQGASPTGVYLAFLGAGAGLAIAVQIASAFLGRPQQLPIDALLRDRTGILLLMALGILVAPLVEETVFRGYIYPVLARRIGVAAGVILTGSLFGLIHAPQLEGAWGHIGLLAIVGIVFTYARARTGTLLASFLLHLGYNGILFFALFVFTQGLRNLPPMP